MNPDTEIGIAIEKIEATIEALHGAQAWMNGTAKDEVSAALEHLNFALGFLSAQKTTED